MNMLFWEWMKKKGYGFVINELSEPNQYYECGLKFVDDNYPLYLIPEQMLIGYMIEYIMEKEAFLHWIEDQDRPSLPPVWDEPRFLRSR